MNPFSTLDRKRVATALVVLVAAFLCGHLMQTVFADRIPVALKNDAPDAAPVIKSTEEPAPLPTPPAATLVPIFEEPPSLPKRVFEQRADGSASGATNCDPRLLASPSPAAMISLTLNAPCHPDTKVVIQQGPMTATDVTNMNGHLHLRIPAFLADTEVTVRVGGYDLTTKLSIPDAPNYQHIALMWEGPQVLRLNAFEFGAARNEIGHVWAGAPKSPNRASRGSGGFLTRLVTDAGPSAEIYSLPAGRAPVQGVVRLTVEGAVTAENCGRVVKAKAIQPTAFRRFSKTDVEVALPDCDRIGEVVLLQNLFRDVRLAGR